MSTQSVVRDVHFVVANHATACGEAGGALRQTFEVTCWNCRSTDAFLDERMRQNLREASDRGGDRSAEARYV